MDRTFSAGGPLRGTASIPGDKAISHRAAIIAAMRRGPSVIHGVANGQDVASTAACIATLGARPTSEGSLVEVFGNGWQVRTDVVLDCGNSGSTMRMLMGALAGRNGRWKLQGDASLSARPMERVASPLRLMGATVGLSEDGTPPVEMSGGGLEGIGYEMQVASAQVKTAVLFAGLMAAGRTTVIERSVTRDHTERILGWLGAPVSAVEGVIGVSGGGTFFDGDGFQFQVPGDISSAAYLAAAAILVPGSQIRIDGVGLNPTRTGFLDVVRRMGAEVSSETLEQDPEPVGTLDAAHSPLVAAQIGGADVPLAIDEIPLIALLATQAEGKTEIRDASELRVKESDRISVVAEGLVALGAKIEELDDGFVIDGPTPLDGGVVDSGGDHRVALTFAVAGLIARSAVTIRGWECSAVSYPSFEEDVKALLS